MGRGTGLASGAALNAPALFTGLRRWNVSPCPAPLHLWGPLPVPIRPAPRLTHEWTEAELDYLEKWYLLKGSAFIRSKYPHLSENGCRQMATRLGLAEDMREFTYAAEVAEEGGVSVQAVNQWLSRNNLRRFCWLLGCRLLLPLPVVRLYLTEKRAASRPRGWWGSARAAEHLGVSTRTLRRMIDAGTVDAVRHGKTDFVDPHSLPPRPPAPPLDAVSLVLLAGLIPMDLSNLRAALRQAGHPVTVYHRPPAHRAAFTTQEAARRFLSARGYREELVELYLRRAVATQHKPKGETP